MKNYSKYKDSTVEWTDEVPEHWAIKPLKYFSAITLGKMLTNEDKGGYFYKPYLRSQNIQSERVDIRDVNEMWFSSEELKTLRLFRGDLLVNEGGDVGRTATWNEELNECYFQNSVNRVHINNGFSHFFLYHFLLHHFTGYFDSVVNRVSIPHLTKEKLSNVSFCFPPLYEQFQITAFLDQKTSIIDDLIQKNLRKIELLKEQRTSIINQAVTKGLNAKVKMKDSGVESIGEIPVHWIKKRLKHICSIYGRIGYRGYTTDDIVSEGEGVITISPGNIKNDIFTIDSVTYLSFEKYYESPEIMIFPRDIILVKTGSTIGKTAIIPENSPLIPIYALEI